MHRAKKPPHPPHFPALDESDSRHAVLLLGALLVGSALFAEVTLASPSTSHPVLQRKMQVPVWGTADSGETVTIEFAGQKKSAAAADGKWHIDSAAPFRTDKWSYPIAGLIEH